ncbi:uncharacterized protein LOC122048220 [Zingiber officinale]|uniref:uncharacterized protein LOC122048220 n=1 Tax=Zingiber officinale TaxID=94328 RepID=UPI001C4AE38D|nr:uncharacterized protein LOC122048220 [Zingiber officinale]
MATIASITPEIITYIRQQKIGCLWNPDVVVCDPPCFFFFYIFPNPMPLREQSSPPRTGMASLPGAFLSVTLLGLFFLPSSIAQASASEKKNNAWLGNLHRQSGKGQEKGLGPWRRLVAEAPVTKNGTVENSTFILAAEKTYRKDPLNGYKHYTGGWNISDQHYWASVGFTAAPLFAISIAWFLGFGLVLFFICCCLCFCRRRNHSYSRVAYALSLILLILFTCAAIIGSGVLYKGQGMFHNSTSKTLEYVVGQANLTADNLHKFSSSLAAAKKVGVDQVFLPADVQMKIDTIQRKLNSSANELSSKTMENSKKIQIVLDTVRLDLIIIAAVMLGLAFLGFLFSIFGLQFLVSMLVLVGWILVAGTFILCGVFLLLHNVVGDACVAMDQWVDHPHSHTALDDILPCVDATTANESMYRSKEVTFQIVNVVNQVISNVSNGNFPPVLAPLYYNQSGPLVPALCNPFNADMSTRACAKGEVNFLNSSTVWKSYICEITSVNGNDVCTTVGRLTPSIYNQMTAATNVSKGLYLYGPFLLQLADCTFVRDTFSSLSENNCPGLELYSAWTYIGLVMVSTAVMLSLIFWVIYARERRHRIYSKQFIAQSGPPHMPL